MPTELPLRRSSRLILLTPDRAMLLFEYRDEHQPPFWATPGGELRSGESFLDAARRELREEIGLEVPIGPVIRERTAVYAVARSTPARWEERYFLVPVGGPLEPTREGWTEEEQATIGRWRWWSREAVRMTNPRLLPDWLPELFETAWPLGASESPRP